MSEYNNKTIGQKFSEYFPNTVSVEGSLKIASIFLVPSLFVIIYNSSVSIEPWIIFLARIILFLGLLFLAIPLLVFLLELAIKLTLKIKSRLFLEKIFKFIISEIIINFFTSIKKAFSFVIYIFIKGAVNMVLADKLKGQETSFLFQKQVNDDHYYPDIFDLNNSNIKLKIYPIDQSKYWRIGFKFSKNEAFPSARLAQDYPLFHLTKGDHTKTDQAGRYEDKLRVTYYDSTGLPKYLDPGEKIVDAYNNEEIILEVLRKSNVTEVIVRNAREELLKEELIGDFRYCRLFAWGDKVEYKIDTKISISKK